jgi:hypothetical protein
MVCTSACTVEVPNYMQEMEVPLEDLGDAIVCNWIAVSTLVGL